jgi:hypothetical protein
MNAFTFRPNAYILSAMSPATAQKAGEQIARTRISHTSAVNGGGGKGVGFVETEHLFAQREDVRTVRVQNCCR